jgi:hypothetical protein
MISKETPIYVNSCQRRWEKFPKPTQRISNIHVRNVVVAYLTDMSKFASPKESNISVGQIIAKKFFLRRSLRAW